MHCQSDRELDFSLSIVNYLQMTTEWCLDYCSGLDYDYFATQNKTFCACGNSYRTQNEIDSCQCDQTCQANSAQICGGLTVSTLYSIYC